MFAASINWHSFLFLLFGGLGCAFALGVLFSNNIVRMAFYLIVSLASTAGLYFLAGAKFVGAMQIMIYVGGTLVLLVFGVMLTAQSAFISLKTRAGDWVMAAVVGSSMLAVLVVAALSVPSWTGPVGEDAVAAEVERRHELDIAKGEAASALGWSLIGIRVDQSRQEDETLREGMSGYLLPFEIVSIHLLVVLIGAAYLARTKTIVSYGRPEVSPFRVSYTDLYFRLEGRVPRQIYWIHAFILLPAIEVAVGVLLTLLDDRFPVLAYVGGVIVGVPLLWASIAVRVKRWHDRNKSGWWVLIVFLPVIGPIWEIIELGFLRGTVGANRYGTDPFEQSK